MQQRTVSGHAICHGMMWFFLGTCLVGMGVSFGLFFVPVDRSRPSSPSTDVFTACTRFDGLAYAKIADRGYEYDRDRQSTVAYFPAYPLLGRGLAALTKWDVRLTLLVASNLALLPTFVVFSVYHRVRWPEAPASVSSAVVGLFALWPAGFFFRMAYSESTLLLPLLLFLCGLARRWPLPVLALLAGLVTAARPVGIAATAAFLWYVISDPTRGGVIRRTFLALAYGPFACWGLLAYMGYQYAHFGTPLAFAQTQDHWTSGVPLQAEPWAKAESLLAFEPVWGCYDPGSLRYWGRGDEPGNVLFNWAFWNPILFVATFGLVVYGAVRCWLSGSETVLGLGLLVIPYLTRAYEMSMASHGRFAAVVVPAYLVLGRILGRWPEWGLQSALVTCAPLLVLWSALFASGHAFY